MLVRVCIGKFFLGLVRVCVGKIFLGLVRVCAGNSALEVKLLRMV